MTTIPEGAVTAEGRTLNEAIKAASAELGVPAMSVSYKIDKAHFLSKNGQSQGQDTVKIAAWARDPAETAGAEAARVEPSNPRRIEMKMGGKGWSDAFRGEGWQHAG